MKANNVVAQISLLTKATPTRLADARLEARMDAFMSVHAKHPVKGLLAEAALKLPRRRFLNVAQGELLNRQRLPRPLKNVHRLLDVPQ